MAANRVLADAERDALARFIRSAIDAERYLLSPRLAPLKAILAKLDPKPQVQPVFAAEAWNAEPGDGQEAALGYECCSTTRHEMPRADLGHSYFASVARAGSSVRPDGPNRSTEMPSEAARLLPGLRDPRGSRVFGPTSPRWCRPERTTNRRVRARDEGLCRRA